MLVNWENSKSGHASISTSITKIISPEKIIAFSPVHPTPKQIPQDALKRTRSPGDVDGENSEHFQRKKRRLRFHLVTSRLSKPYAAPATHIISRKMLRGGLSARHMLGGRSHLLRAAILNSIRVRKDKSTGEGRQQIEVPEALKTEEDVNAMDIDIVPAGIRTPRIDMGDCSASDHVPASPSPLGPWNYDAYDHEDEPFEEDEDEDEDEENNEGEIYSNFDNIGAEAEDIEDYDTLSPFSGSGDDQTLIRDSSISFRPLEAALANGA
ncbi:MAG: hypothetical protein Q9190_006617 [Brigantiaea leucoxantha]